MKDFEKCAALKAEYRSASYCGKCVIGGIKHNSPDGAEKYARTLEKQGGRTWQEKDF